ncbi:hypothetical protein ACFPJ4_01815 [Lysinimonas soli]|uniref:FUSC family protein n=1 Tax=Lysinimonas soli TaxID=1074233 RepID=A0ABW0NKZ3_9MICO
MIERRSLTVSPQQIDPLSWFTGRVVPLVFAGLIVLYGAFRIPTWFTTPLPWVQPLAVLLCATACVFVYVMTRPLRGEPGWIVGIVTVAIGGAGFVLSAIGYAGTNQSIELMWGPFGLALAISSLAPYLSARRVLVLGGVGTLVFTLLAYWFIQGDARPWGPLTTMVIIASPVICGLVAAVTFSYALVNRMLPVIEQRSQRVLTRLPYDEEAERTERLRLARLSARAVPFLEGIAASGEITPQDRGLAGQLARRLRDDLVTQSNLSWLDSIASESRLVVVDPERRAERMRPAQRTALRAMLRAVLATPGADRGSLLIDLRGRPDGATAVAISMDVDLPEGRRIMHLAPYYLTLRAAVDEMNWDTRTLSFTVTGS